MSNTISHFFDSYHDYLAFIFPNSTHQNIVNLFYESKKSLIEAQISLAYNKFKKWDADPQIE